MQSNQHKRNSDHRNPVPGPWKILALATLSLCISACASTQQRHALITRTLQSQNELFRKLKDERSFCTIKQKIRADDDLQAAEDHLNESIDALLHSNQALLESAAK